MEAELIYLHFIQPLKYFQALENLEKFMEDGKYGIYPLRVPRSRETREVYGGR